MRRTCLALLVTQWLPTTCAQRPYIMNWSSQSYGPDGPWQAVTILVGSNEQPVALYPGASFASTIFSDKICANSTLSDTCYAASSGVYNESQSTTSISPDGADNSSSSWNIFYWAVQGSSRQVRVADQVTLDETSIPNVSFTEIYDTYQTYPNGRSYPVTVGNLALGGPRLRDTTSGLSLNMIASYLYTTSRIPSYSYGMHIGSVNPPIPGSLVLGGYDRSRIVGQASSQPLMDSAGVLQIVLRDIGLGVAEGASPFPSFTGSHRGGLFLQDQTENMDTPLPRLVTVDPTKPYMYLPKATCSAIASFLPISFDTGLGLYIWDRTSGEYSSLTSSPAYISFTFSKDGSTSSVQNITIRVPLRLLNLTLQEPLVAGRNLTYFPCFLSTDTPVLGRAFLQAAFVAVNWAEGENNGTWGLGQAPGPRIKPRADITPIAIRDRVFRGGEQGAWEETWAGHWTPLEDRAAVDHNGTQSSSASSLSAGAKAGIGVGVGIAGCIILVAAGATVMSHRRRKIDGLPLADEPALKSQHAPIELESKGNMQPREIMETGRQNYELE
ncbi:aspartic peptidase domain-containing protein [Aspergillus insuetus]